ncbi:MAG: hypothetical protein E7540_01900 [Ruminococcaceae bacterium]|nr:hypothetical protein [Oscillospiraceae bacterium]
MKYKVVLTASVISCFALCLVVFSSGATAGAIHGLNLCYSVVIPSLFPFMVCSLVLFKTKILTTFADRLERITLSIFSLDSECFTVFLLSLIGGFPVGAKLIEKLYVDKKISKKTAELMLGFCVNSGPSFIVITVGAGILSNKTLGYILLFSSIISSFLVALIFSRFIRPQPTRFRPKNEKFVISETIIKSTYDATTSIINICSFVVLFSTIIGLIDSYLSSSSIIRNILPLLEITSGIKYYSKNIFFISFIIGFAGICVHFQVISSCKTININYFKFFMFRIFHGALCSFCTYILLKIFKISVPTVSINPSLVIEPSRYTIVFGIVFIALSVLFIVSTRKFSKTI